MHKLPFLTSIAFEVHATTKPMSDTRCLVIVTNITVYKHKHRELVCCQQSGQLATLECSASIG